MELPQKRKLLATLALGDQKDNYAGWENYRWIVLVVGGNSHRGPEGLGVGMPWSASMHVCMYVCMNE